VFLHLQGKKIPIFTVPQLFWLHQFASESKKPLRKVAQHFDRCTPIHLPRKLCHLFLIPRATTYMRTSNFLIATQKETPADAEVVSHQLMLRAGLIRKLAAGLYTWQ